MAKKATPGRARKRRRRAATIFISENMQTGDKSPDEGGRLDAGKVRRIVLEDTSPGLFEFWKKYRAITPARRITPVIKKQDDNQEKKESTPKSWIKSLIETWFHKPS